MGHQGAQQHALYRRAAERHWGALPAHVHDGHALHACMVHGPSGVFFCCMYAAATTALGHSRCEVARILSSCAVPLCLQKLVRKRVLGSGPYGALRASYSSDGQAIVTLFKVGVCRLLGTDWGADRGGDDNGRRACLCCVHNDARGPACRLQDGSFYVWASGTFALLRSFTLPVAPALRVLQSTFVSSPDGQLVVAGGANVPLLYVYSAISGALLHTVVLPSPPSLSSLQQQQQEQQHAGAGGDDEALALGSALVGVQQLQFLEDSATVAGASTARHLQAAVCCWPHVLQERVALC